MEMQEMIEVMGRAWRQSRENYHVTLGKAIEALSALPADKPVVFAGGDVGPAQPHSYRGYYSDLAFEGHPGVTVRSFLSDCRAALDNTYEGYKGGDFVMDANTPLWCASYGMSGLAIIDLIDGDSVVLVTKKVD